MRKFFTKQYLLICALLTITTVALAQQTATITGKVSDENNQPLPGAVVTVKGTHNASPVDVQGNFRLSGIPYGAVTLRVTFIGYQTLDKTITVNGNTKVSFSLLPGEQGLNEVVVIGYGTQRKKDLTGSIATVTAKDFNTGDITTPEQLIQGKVAGVSIITNSGAPGAGSQILIRGGASVSGSNQPLIVIDGVPLSNDNIAGAANPLDMINPNDIESFSILKDASAAAIYGNRASNGVILITTKKGKAGKPQLFFSTQFSVSKIAKEAPTLTPSQFRTYINQVATAPGDTLYTHQLKGFNTDWQKEIYQTAVSNDNNFSVSGTAGLLPYRVSVGYTDEDGILKTSSLQRISGNLSLTPSLLTDHLKIDFNLIASQADQRFAATGAIGAANNFNPTLPVYSGNNKYGGFEEITANSATGLLNLAPLNPLGLLEEENNSSTVSRVIASLAVDYRFHFFPDLHANVSFAHDGSNGGGYNNFPSYAASQAVGAVDANNVTQHGSFSRYSSIVGNSTLDGHLSYAHDFKSIKSHVDAVAGYSTQDFSTIAYNYLTYFANGEVNPASVPNYPYSLSQYDLASVYARVNYAYDDKYLLTGTFRQDVSTRFAPGIRTGNFPSVAAAWVISNEGFLKGNTTLSNLKLRLEYGVTGNQDGILDYSYLSDYTLSNTTAQYPFGNTFYQQYRPGGFYEGRTWEQTATANIGLDYGFMNGRISGSLDIYSRKTSHLLAQINEPAGTNFSTTIIANVGNMQDRGAELSVSAKIIDSKDISWNLGVNATYNKNKITNLTQVPNPNFPGIPQGSISGGIGTTIQIDQIGYPKNSFFTYQQVYGANGKPLDGVFVDKNGDGVISGGDLSVNHGPDPQEYFGINSDLRVKQWNIGFSARASLGNYVYNNVASTTGFKSNFLSGLNVVENGSNNVLETGFTGQNAGNEYLSDYFIQNASFFRMDNIHLGYNFGKVFKNTGDFRITANVQNVFIITNYTGVDPEVTNGIDNNLYPRPRTYVLGLNLTL